MALLDLITPADLDAFFEKVSNKVDELRPALKNAMDCEMTVNEIAEYTGHNRNTVINWMRHGKRDRFDNVYKLKFGEYSPGDYRVLKSDLIEYRNIKDCQSVVPERKARRSKREAA